MRAAGEDLELVLRMRAQDEGALGLFFDRWSPLLRSFVRHLVADASAADDVVEETFWQAWRQADRYDAERGDVATWLFMICRSRALMHLRARRRLREEPFPAADAPELLRFQVAPENNAELAERRALVLSALGQLPAEQRQIVDLAFFHGLSQSEIASHTGHALGTVKTRTRLAFEKLRRLLPMLRESV